ncbi:acyltransferase [Acerihabitans sp. TG2]|uniref:acyltransferase family protein n=1 Tax=Acerihabitans sp. TG2 TaxID=3096008 RepID=UPI002B22B025|nr:acyltransferase [Acerihabitans sp. TG2]MEA9391056.1 acyltransferase [Acerihabitans sp. TG2]
MKPIDNPIEKDRFIGLEWLRFLMGCYIMLYHTAHTYPQIKSIRGLDELTSMGFFATSTFFVLSGFLLAHVYVRGDRLRDSAKTFWAKRLFNLYPIHIMALLFSILVISLMQWLAIPPEGPTSSVRFVVYDTNELLGQTHPELFRHYMDNIQLVFNSVLQLFMLQAWNPYFLTFNAPLWSLSALFFFYVLFPYCAPKLMNAQHTWLWLAAVWMVYLLPPVWVIWQQLYGIPYTGLLQRLPIFRVPEFFGGILGYALFRQARLKQYVLTLWQCRAIGAFIVVCFLVATALFTHGDKYWYFLLHNGLLLPSQIALVYLCSLARTPQNQWVRRWAPRLGAASLSIFAFHVPLFNLTRTLEQFFRGSPLTCLSDWSGCIAAAGEVQLSLSGYAIYILLTILLCMVFQEQFVTRVRLRLSARFLSKDVPPPGFTPCTAIDHAAVGAPTPAQPKENRRK